MRVAGHGLGERQVAVAVVEERRVEHPVAVGRDELVEHELHGWNAEPGGLDLHARGRIGLVVDVRVVDAPDAAEVVEHDLLEEPAVVGNVVDDPSPTLGLGQRGQPLGHW